MCVCVPLKRGVKREKKKGLGAAANTAGRIIEKEKGGADVPFVCAVYRMGKPEKLKLKKKADRSLAL